MPSPAPVAPPTTTALAILMATGIGLSFFLALGAYPLFDVDEGAFSGATLEMFQRGDFLSTTLNGAPFGPTHRSAWGRDTSCGA
jgi:4-amino-4-deoxy-L-arabinose transferase-like glycosyltransferase